MKKTLFIFSIVALAMAVSCRKKQVSGDVGLLGLDYYPYTTGKYIVYDVDSTVYTQLTKDTIYYKYRIKEKIADSFIDNQGNTAFRLERYIKKFDPKKSYDSIPWTIKEVWMLNADNNTVQVVESNLRYTKLTFPIQEKATWNGNANNSLGEWEYVYDYIDKAETINSTKFENVLKVKQKFYNPLIAYQSYYEKYAKGTGLVYREMIDVISNTVVKDVPVLNRIESGTVYKQTYVSSGYE
ncbi:MAG: hypothetical protein IT236_06790 [Bacteroidia bacterium]|nr:hypothetical protein [Bacteroidia bacterium]